MMEEEEQVMLRGNIDCELMSILIYLIGADTMM